MRAISAMSGPVFPIDRLLCLNEKPVNAQGQYVLYWMVANRRLAYNYSLDRAIDYAIRLNKPLLVVESLAKGYPWSSPRFHHFVMKGMQDNIAVSDNVPLSYYPFVETDRCSQSGMLSAFSKNACLVVTDDFPCFFIPKLLKIVGRTVPCRAEAIDSNGIMPMRVESEAIYHGLLVSSSLSKSFACMAWAISVARSLVASQTTNVEVSGRRT